MSDNALVVLESSVASVTQVVERLVALVRRLAGLGDLGPGPSVNVIFEDLVSTCVCLGPAFGNEVYEHPQIQALREQTVQLCAAGETELEYFWARRLVADPDPQQLLQSFPYLHNYERLVQMEWQALGLAGLQARPDLQLTVVGGGPLPLTAIVLQKLSGARIVVLDRDPLAVELSGQLLQRLGLGHLIQVVLADVRDAPEVMSSTNAVLVAALVGLDPQTKREVMTGVSQWLDPQTPVLFRSAAGLRRLLYPQIDLGDLVTHGFDVVLELQPWDEIVNSVVVTRCEGPHTRVTDCHTGSHLVF